MVSIRSDTAATPVSTSPHWPRPIRIASPAAVLAAKPGTGTSCWPTSSARTRSRPTMKSSPVNCADATPTKRPPAPTPRRRCPIGPTAASIDSATRSRPTSSVTETMPASPVRYGSGAPMRTRMAARPAARTVFTTKVPFCKEKAGFNNHDYPCRTGTFAISHTDQHPTNRGFGSDPLTPRH